MVLTLQATDPKDFEKGAKKNPTEKILANWKAEDLKVCVKQIADTKIAFKELAKKNIVGNLIMKLPIVEMKKSYTGKEVVRFQAVAKRLMRTLIGHPYSEIKDRDMVYKSGDNIIVSIPANEITPAEKMHQENLNAEKLVIAEKAVAKK